MSHQTRNAFALTLSLFAAFAAHAICRPVGGRPPETRVVWVRFESCEDAEPSGPFRVQIGNHNVRLKKEKPDDEFWRGETLESFAIRADRTLKIDVQEMPNARTACNVPPVPYDAGACVALYTVKCETLWMLNVAIDPPDAQAKLSYVRKPDSKTVLPCEKLITPDGPGTIELGKNESILVTVEIRRGQLVAVPLSLSSFRRDTKKLTLLKNLKQHATSQDTAGETGRAIDALVTAQLRKILKDLEFTRE